MKSSFDTVRDTFYSGQFAFKGDLEPIQKIAFLIDHKYLNLEIVEITSKIRYLETLNKPEEIIKVDEASGGDIAHVALKLLAKEYLETFCSERIVFEQQFYGLYPDVMVHDGSIIIECGHTDNADKIFTYFMQDKTQKVILVPYPSEDDVTIQGYILTANKNLSPFLLEERKDSDKNILDILNKKRK